MAAQSYISETSVFFSGQIYCAEVPSTYVAHHNNRSSVVELFRYAHGIFLSIGDYSCNRPYCVIRLHRLLEVKWQGLSGALTVELTFAPVVRPM